MKASKQQQILDWMKRPIEVGDNVNIRIPFEHTGKEKVGRKYVETKTIEWSTDSGVVAEIIDNPTEGLIYRISNTHCSKPYECKKIPGLVGYDQSDLYYAEWVTPCILHIGVDHFQDAPRITFYNQTIESVLSNCGYGRRSNITDVMERQSIPEKDGGGTYGGCNFDPYVIDKDGVKQYYQRGLVWTEDQKRDLISTIYAGGEIGKFVFRYNSWNSITRQIKESGHGYNWDSVDGKQRVNAILEFILGKYPDEYGDYWSDLSASAQGKFLRYDRLSYGKLDENSTDDETIRAFMYVNTKGTPVDTEHLRKVASIKIQ